MEAEKEKQVKLANDLTISKTQIEALTKAFKNEKAKHEAAEKECSPTNEKLASLTKEL